MMAGPAHANNWFRLLDRLRQGLWGRLPTRYPVTRASRSRNGSRTTQGVARAQE